MPSATVNMYEVPVGFLTTKSPQTIGTVIDVTITDDDTILHTNEIADPGSSQVFTTPAGTVGTPYTVQFTMTMQYTPAGASAPVSIDVVSMQLIVNGVPKYYIFASQGNQIPGLVSGGSVVRTSDRVSYTNTVTYADLACFASGTLIATQEGLRRVEDIAVGDLVLTADRGPQAVRWAGAARLGPADLLLRPELRPVRVRAGALGAGLPKRDLVLSPQHRLLLSGWRVEMLLGEAEVLAPVKHLIGRPGVEPVQDCRAVGYHHLMFDRHEIVFAEGLPAESFYLGERMRCAMEAGMVAEILALFPELADRPPRPARAFARGYEVAALAGSG